MKRFILMVCMISMMTLMFGCNRQEDLDTETIEDIFDSLIIDTDAIMANRISYEESESVDQMEIYDATNRDEIVFHFITTSDNVLDQRDEMIMVTPDFIYRTRTMKRYVNDLDPHDDNDFKLLIERYCDIIDLDYLTTSNLEDVALNLNEPKRFKENRNYVLRGMIDNIDTPEDMVDVIEFEYENDRLLELRLRREHTYRSTKQQSNFLSGTHYFFMSSLFEEFPDLNQFGDA